MDVMRAPPGRIRQEPPRGGDFRRACCMLDDGSEESHASADSDVSGRNRWTTARAGSAGT